MGLVKEIQEGSDGAAVRLIYQIKLKHTASIQQAKEAPSDRMTLQERAAQFTLPRLNQPKSPRTDEETEVMYKLTQSLTNKPARHQHEALHQKKFQIAYVRGQREARTREQEADFARSEQVLLRRKEFMDSMNENRKFKQEWEREGVKNWRANRKADFKRVQEQVMFVERVEKQKTDLLHSRVNMQSKQTVSDIAHFQTHLERVVGTETKLDTNEDLSIESKAKFLRKNLVAGQTSIAVGSAEAAGAEAAFQRRELEMHNERVMTNIHAKTMSAARARKERERRRRKVQVEQDKAGALVEKTGAQERLLKRVHELCQQERMDAQEAWAHRIYAVQEVVNSNIRVQRQAKARQEFYDSQASLREEATLVEIADLAKTMEEDLQKYAKLRTQRLDKKRTKAELVCRDIVGRLVGLGMGVALYKEENNNKLVPPALWREWIGSLWSDNGEESDSGERSTEKDSATMQNGTTAAKPMIVETDIANSYRYAAANLLSMQHDTVEPDSRGDRLYQAYRNGVDRWAPESRSRSDHESAGSKGDAAVTQPDTTASFARMVARIAAIAEGTANLTPDPTIPDKPIGICLLGKPSSGGSQVAQWMLQQHGLRTLNIPELCKVI